jgi:hypothetical protein
MKQMTEKEKQIFNNSKICHLQKYDYIIWNKSERSLPHNWSLSRTSASVV